MTIGSYPLRRRRLSTSLGLGILLAQFCVAPPIRGAQQQPQPEQLSSSEGMTPPPTFLTETKLVTVNFAFHPSAKHRRLKMRNAPELGADDIEILDNGVPQRVAVLERTGMEGGRLPTDVILLFDSGRRFRQYIDPRRVNLHFIDELESVRISIYGFSDFTYRLIRPTRDMAQLTAAIANLSRIPNVASTSADAILQTIQDSVTISGSRPRMMIIYSGAVEGACQMPRNDYEKVVELAKGYDIALFPVAIQPQRPSFPPASVDGRKAIRDPLPESPGMNPVRFFLDIGPATGGKGFFRYAMPETVFREVFQYVRSQARSEYSAGFYPGVLSKAGRVSHRIEARRKSNIGEISGGVRTATY